MFKTPIAIIGWILVVLMCVWAAGMVFTNNSCTRIYRTGWPAWYSFELVEFVSQNWTGPSTKLMFLKYKVKSTLSLQVFFQTTIYGDSLKCKL